MLFPLKYRTIPQYGDGTSSSDQAVEAIQSLLQCCGYQSKLDYDLTVLINLPSSCCEGILYYISNTVILNLPYYIYYYIKSFYFLRTAAASQCRYAVGYNPKKVHDQCRYVVNVQCRTLTFHY